MASVYDATSSIFGAINVVVVVAYNLATALWGSTVCNSVIFALSSKQPTSKKLLVDRMDLHHFSSNDDNPMKEYVAFGFIVSDSGPSEGESDLIMLTTSVVLATCETFFIHELSKRFRRDHLLSILSLPAVSFPMVFSLGCVFASPSSIWYTYHKNMLLMTIILHAALDTLICAGLLIALLPSYFSRPLAGNRKLEFTSRLLSLAVDSNFLLVFASISNIIMFYFLFSYSSLFVLYMHTTSSLSFMTTVSFLETEGFLINLSATAPEKLEFPPNRISLAVGQRLHLQSVISRPNSGWSAPETESREGEELPSSQ
ncbi:hypothetical protein CVT26_008378 [Gymnopilus dilepis]|uniref:Uncharacterized protein n=1 Tax=Gymnopilus dilepis TaxID=231916 RepID=A0A409XY87_9AGAR|nr:hypothetical protein CVT26_008378 [Gymnopilus dilepis]